MSNPSNPMTNPAKPPLTPAEDKQWAFLAHCGGVLGCIPSALIYKFMAGRGPFTEQESLEALNFTLPPTILALALNIIALVVGIFSPSVGTVFSMLALIVWVFLTVCSVIAAIQVSRGNPYRYPWNLRRIH
ncbi:DUF4870 domain-containing protein [Arthrobacter sp. STN4]|uniref:DUF4870 domain-containing protein n=1 Tax=Arthrobacter sp. STN4 TaxID=2923276 RepID=UPI00211A181C|nr:DUF4870 domain-containing protein [Arthrobacter sp. STN4]MCQ9164409.1 DUF4870 domain-containing protein [Arthrobacter sp. STN4]